MQNEVVVLKQKIKILQRELCDRTRNYLYHFKKSPVKRTSTLVDSQTQTDTIAFVEEATQQTSLMQETHFANISIQPYSHQQQQQSILPQQGHQAKLVSNTHVYEQTHLHNDIQSLTREIESMKSQLQSTRTPQRYTQCKSQFLNPLSHCSTPIKHTDNTQFSKKKQIQTVDQLSESRFNGQCSQLSSIEQDHHVKEIKILKKQIKKLKSRLETEFHVSSETKQALLISEQENYKFRLQIQRLNKQIQVLTGVFSSSDTDDHQTSTPLFTLNNNNDNDYYQPYFKPIDSSSSDQQSQSTKQQLQKYKNQSQKYQQHISMLQGVKRDYLKKCIQAKEEICRLKQEKEVLRAEVKELKVIVRKKEGVVDYVNDGKLGAQKVQTEWMEVLGEKIHEISNCLPLTDNHQQFLFQPDNVEDMLLMLERILNFCKNIEGWEKERIQCIEKQRANLLKILSSVLLKHPETKQTIAEQILEIPQLKYLVNFMNKQPKSPLKFGENSNLEGIIEQANYPNAVSMN